MAKRATAAAWTTAMAATVTIAAMPAMASEAAHPFMVFMACGRLAATTGEVAMFFAPAAVVGTALAAAGAVWMGGGGREEEVHDYSDISI